MRRCVLSALETVYTAQAITEHHSRYVLLLIVISFRLFFLVYKLPNLPFFVLRILLGAFSDRPQGSTLPAAWSMLAAFGPGK